MSAADEKRERIWVNGFNRAKLATALACVRESAGGWTPEEEAKLDEARKLLSQLLRAAEEKCEA